MSRTPHDFAANYRDMALDHARRVLRTEYISGIVIGVLFGFCAGFLFCLWVVL